MALTKKVADRLARQFENATSAELGEALAAAEHVLKGTDSEAKAEAALVKEFIETKLDTSGIKAPETVNVTAKSYVTVDGVPYTKGQSGKITKKQYAALSRHFELVKLLVLFCSLAFGFNAGAQQYKPTLIGNTSTSSVIVINGTSVTNAWSLSGGTNVVAAAPAINSYSNAITVTKYDMLSLQTSFKLTSTGTSNVTVYVDYSVDGPNYASAFAWTIAANGTTPVTAITNLTVIANGYYRFTSVSNANANPVTNLVALYATKAGRTGN